MKRHEYYYFFDLAVRRSTHSPRMDADVIFKKCPVAVAHALPCFSYRSFSAPLPLVSVVAEFLNVLSNKATPLNSVW